MADQKRRGRLAPGLLLAALLAVAGSAACGAVESGPASDRADEHWSQRARGLVSGRIDPEPAEQAIRLWQEALERQPESLEVRFKLMEGLYFKGHFLERAEGPKRQLFDRLTDLAEETVDLAESGGTPTDHARAHFWAAIAWGLRGMSHGYVWAGTRGVAGRIRGHAQEVVDLDPEFADAGGLRLLGRLHAATPRIPLFTGWVDRRRGIELLQRAHGISQADPRNALFLAEALLEYEPGSRDRAIELLRQVAALTPDPAQLVEQSETLDRARLVLRQQGIEE